MSLSSNSYIDSHSVLAFGGGIFGRELALEEEVMGAMLWNIS